MVKTYVNIENTRFEDKIKLHIKSQKEYDNILIPKFSIQLLVENAIKHGFINEELNIHIKIEDNSIIVSNDGKVSENVKFGTGLSNLNKRLELLEVGKLTYDNSDRMKFIIKVNDESINS